MPKFVLSFFVLLFAFFLFLSPVAAADPTPGPPTCDLCGWCQPDPKPPTWAACNACLYAGGVKQNKYYTVFGCFDSTPGAAYGPFVRSILSVLFGVSGGIAFLYFLYGSALVLTSQGDPFKLQNGKDTITSSLIGIFLIVFSVFLLRVVGYDILRIPGFG